MLCKGKADAAHYRQQKTIYGPIAWL